MNTTIETLIPFTNHGIYFLKASKSHKRWGNFQYIKLPQRSFFGRIQDSIFSFRDFLTFTTIASNTLFKSPAPQVLENSGLQKAEIFGQSERFSLLATEV